MLCQLRATAAVGVAGEKRIEIGLSKHYTDKTKFHGSGFLVASSLRHREAGPDLARGGLGVKVTWGNLGDCKSLKIKNARNTHNHERKK